jgi:hypothetical protein
MLAATHPVIGGLAKDGPIRTKPILEATPEVPEPAIVIYVRRRIIELPMRPSASSNQYVVACIHFA